MGNFLQPSSSGEEEDIRTMKVLVAILLLAAAVLVCYAAPDASAANLFDSFDTGYEPVELAHPENGRAKNKKWEIVIKKPSANRAKRAPEAANLFESFDTGYEPVELVHPENSRKKNKKWEIIIKPSSVNRAKRAPEAVPEAAPEAVNLFSSFDTGYEPVELVHRENARDKNKKWTISVGQKERATFNPFSGR